MSGHKKKAFWRVNRTVHTYLMVSTGTTRKASLLQEPAPLVLKEEGVHSNIVHTIHTLLYLSPWRLDFQLFVSAWDSCVSDAIITSCRSKGDILEYLWNWVRKIFERRAGRRISHCILSFFASGQSQVYLLVIIRNYSGSIYCLISISCLRKPLLFEANNECCWSWGQSLQLGWALHHHKQYWFLIRAKVIIQPRFQTKEKYLSTVEFLLSLWKIRSVLRNYLGKTIKTSIAISWLIWHGIVFNCP